MVKIVDDVRKEVAECVDEGYGYGYIRIFLHDLARSHDITWQDVTNIELELANGVYGRRMGEIPTYDA